jgi:hypothetical protein
MIFENTGTTRRFFFDIAFLEKARLTNDPTREFMSGINVEYKDDKVFMAATNARFMNIIEYEKKDAPDIENGIYTIRKCAKDMIILEKSNDIASFPDWRRVVPEHNILAVENISVYEEKRTDNHSFYELVYILNNLGCFINHDFIKTIAALNVAWDIYLNPYKINSVAMLKNHTKHILSNGKYTIVIAPLSNKCHAIISNALALLDKTLQAVNKDKEEVLFADTIHKKQKPLFEM